MLSDNFNCLNIIIFEFLIIIIDPTLFLIIFCEKTTFLNKILGVSIEKISPSFA